MFLDASAIIAIIAAESEADVFGAKLGRASKVYVSPIVVHEATLGLARKGNIAIADARRLLDHFLENVSAESIPVSTALGERAIAAFERFGKGRHKASLNLGDCFAYACAQELGVPLLFKGDDFSQTDVRTA